MKAIELVLKEFGGVRPLARALGVSHTTVSGWHLRSAIPRKMQKPILLMARKYKKKISAEDLILCN